MSRSMFRLLITVAILTLAAWPTLAQQIQGQVRTEGGQAAFAIPVRCEGTGFSGEQITDRSGKFRFVVTPGHYTVSIHIPGYQDVQRSVDLLDTGSSEYVFFQLKSDGSGAAPAAKITLVDPKVPAPARKEYEDGLKEVNAGKMDKAIPHLEKAVTLYPDFLEAQLLLGTARMDAKQWDKAEAALRRAIEIDPKRAEAHAALGELYYQQKKYPEAEKSLQEALKIQDNAWQAHFTLARVYMDTNVFDKAAPQMEKANQLRPDYAEGHFLAGNIYIKTGNGEGALKEFEEYLRLAPKGKFAPQVRTTVAKLKEILKK